MKSLFKRKPADSAVDATNHDAPVEVETSLLEQHIKEERESDPAAFAAEQLSTFQLTPGAKSLLDRSLDNAAKNTGEGLEDPDARIEVQLRAAVIDAAGNDLNIAIEALTASSKPTEIASVVQSLLYNVLKGAVFIANIDRQRYLDPNADFDMTMYTDRREEVSPMDGQTGHTPQADWNLEELKVLYGRDFGATEDVFATALEDLRLFFQLTVEAFGWDPDRPMPFGNVMEKDGSFTPIHDPEAALDQAEIKRQVSRAKRRDRTNTTLAAAAARAKEIVRAALQR